MAVMVHYLLLALYISLYDLLPNVMGARLRRGRLDRNTSTAKQEQVYEYKLHLRNYQNVQYFGEFTVGGQTLPVVYDTGSFEVIVLSTLCTDCEVGSPIYDSKQSSTFHEGDGAVVEHVFGSGPVLSRRGLDVCQVGPTSSPLISTMMPFWQVMDHDIAVWDRYSQFSGIIGLGHSPRAPAMLQNSDQKNSSGRLLTARNDNYVLLERLGVTSFSICLERGQGTPPGWLKMGSLVESAGESSIFKHVAVIGQVHWGVAMTQLRAGGLERTNPCSPACAAIVDSGTSLIAAPPSAMDALAPLFNSIKKDCSNLAELPDIEFNLGGVMFDLPPQIYVMQLTHFVEKPQAVWERMYSPPELIAVTECVPSFMSIDMQTENSGPLWILGMPFLRYYHTVFQRSPKVMHIAYADPNCEPTAYKPSIFVNMSAGLNGSAPRTGSGVAHATLPRAEKGGEPGIRLPSWAKNGAKIEL